jgi:UDPglucose--hexose-1-phosphate uridylyltransferase
MQDWLRAPHRRWNPLSREWVLVSPQRAARPWQGQTEAPAENAALCYDPSCYLCPGNARAGGARNPPYQSTFVFDNDFPALLPQEREGALDQDGLFVAESERGICRVLCFSPRHDLTISRMEAAEIEIVVKAWREEVRRLDSVPWVGYVQVFENRGALMGASNPHPHCQIWASEHIPNEIAKEQMGQREHSQRRGACLLCRYAQAERGGERMMCENASFLALTPFWAIWPFEILVIPARHFATFQQMSETEQRDLAAILQAITRRYDALFSAPFPYSMGFHPAPSRSADASWHFHAHFLPPLLRSATTRKFMVGYELLANAQRDLTPEMAAERIRRAGTLLEGGL